MPVVGVGLAGLDRGRALAALPGGGRFPFSKTEFAAGVVFCVVCLTMTWRVESARILRFVFAVYLVALVLAFAIPSAVGENVIRLRYAAIPMVVLVFSLRRWEPRVLGVAALTLAVSWNLTPLVWSYVHGVRDETTTEAVWATPIDFLRANLDPSYRVEAVDTSTHSGAVYLAEAGIPLARGWYRQDDFPQNELLYDKLGPRAYLAWLRGLGVKYVVLSDGPTDYSSHGEARLVRSGRAGLQLVFRTPDLAVYEVPNAQAIVTGPAHPRIASMTETQIGVVVRTGGTYRIAVRWSPYWHASLGCLSRGDDGMVRLTTRRAHFVRLTFRVNALARARGARGRAPDLPVALEFANDFVERLALRALRPLLRGLRLRIARLGRVAEGEHDADRLADERFGRGSVSDAVRHRADAVAPGGEHHVLCGAADVERCSVAGDRDDELRAEHVRGRIHKLRDRVLVAHDDELPLLRVLRRAAQPSGVEDPAADVVGNRPVRVTPCLPAARNRVVDVHGRDHDSRRRALLPLGPGSTPGGPA